MGERPTESSEPADGATSNSAAPVIDASDLSIEYPRRTLSPVRRAIDGVNFQVMPGEILGIVGMTGSGKSVLADALAGIELRGQPGSPRITGGKLTLHGREMRHASGPVYDEISRLTGYMPADASSLLRPDLTIADNLAVPVVRWTRNVDPHSIGRLAAELIERVGLPMHVLGLVPSKLSKGQQQRVALVYALMLRPKLLVLDDPLAGLDVTIGPQIVDLVRLLSTEAQTAVVVSSSDPRMALRFTDRLLVLDDGFQIAYGKLADIDTERAHPYVRAMTRLIDHATSNGGAR